MAVFKASLVVLYFMHLKYSSKLTWVVVGAGVFWLAILLSIDDGGLPDARLDDEPDHPALDDER